MPRILSRILPKSFQKVTPKNSNISSLDMSQSNIFGRILGNAIELCPWPRTSENSMKPLPPPPSLEDPPPPPPPPTATMMGLGQEPSIKRSMFLVWTSVLSSMVRMPDWRAKPSSRKVHNESSQFGVPLTQVSPLQALMGSLISLRRKHVEG